MRGPTLEAPGSRDAQVLCVTHLAQIACFADHHFYVEKSARANRTVTTIKPLAGEKERAEELARMLSGSQITDAVLQTRHHHAPPSRGVEYLRWARFPQKAKVPLHGVEDSPWRNKVAEERSSTKKLSLATLGGEGRGHAPRGEGAVLKFRSIPSPRRFQIRSARIIPPLQGLGYVRVHGPRALPWAGKGDSYLVSRFFRFLPDNKPMPQKTGNEAVPASHTNLRLTSDKRHFTVYPR